ncbi:MAG: NnrS family protein [Pseudomonadota bacterium]
MPVDVAGAALLVAGVGTVIRLACWRVWRRARRPDLLILALGYGWLAAGLALLGAARFAVVPVLVGVHAVTIGALGTLTITVMARTRLLFRFRDANVAPEAHLAGLLMSVAALARTLLPGTRPS